MLGQAAYGEPFSQLLTEVTPILVAVSRTGSSLKTNLLVKTSPGLNRVLHLLLKIMSMNGRIHQFSQGKEKMIPLTYITAITIKRYH